MSQEEEEEEEEEKRKVKWKSGMVEEEFTLLHLLSCEASLLFTWFSLGLLLPGEESQSQVREHLRHTHMGQEEMLQRVDARENIAFS